MNKNIPIDVDTYIRSFPESTQVVLEKLRSTIKKAAPGAQEVISYQMPAYNYFGMLVYFAGYKHHIGFYPTASGIEAFKKELTNYKLSKGTIQFLLDKPLPIQLITKIVKYRVAQNIEKYNKKNLKKCKNGHEYVKSSDCKVCPVCEKKSKPVDGFLSLLSAPARRALINSKITSLKELSNYKQADILKLHGIGPTAIPKLKMALEAVGLSFKK